MCGKDVIEDIISCFSAISILLFVAVEIINSCIRKYISISANDEFRTQQMEIVELVEKRDDMT
jgi:diacylglycerol kinase